MPTLRNKEVRGDHYVTLVIQTPDKLSNEAKELLRQFDAAAGDSLNATKRAFESQENGDAKENKESGKESGKKKKFWK